MSSGDGGGGLGEMGTLGCLVQHSAQSREVSLEAMSGVEVRGSEVWRRTVMRAAAGGMVLTLFIIGIGRSCDRNLSNKRRGDPAAVAGKDRR